MASTFEGFSFAGLLPRAETQVQSTYQRIYDENRHRVYALSFWMTDNELTAEELMERTFRRAFQGASLPSAQAIDQALIFELRELMPLGALTLDCNACREVASVRNNTLRVHLERAVVQLPATERMIFLLHDVESYDHERIGTYLGLSLNDCQQALHQARLRIRELLADMI